MIKTTYVTNMIEITTHGVDLLHHRLRLVKRNLKSPIEPPQGERGGGRKRVRGLLMSHSR
jgi:hypothetical protein